MTAKNSKYQDVLVCVLAKKKKKKYVYMINTTLKISTVGKQKPTGANQC